jgi:regulator of protease activity HflC (stomatin/prohibitin superfamily)
MREPEALDPSHLPRFQRAARQGALIARVFWACAVLVVLLLWLLWRNWLPDWRLVLLAQSAALLVLMASLQSVWWLTRWRARALVKDPFSPPPPGAKMARLRGLFHRSRRRLSYGFTRHTDLAAALGTGILALLALALLWGDWSWMYADSAIASTSAIALAPLVVAGTLLALAFVLLVLERFYAGGQARELPEAIQIAYVLRVVITVALLLAGGILLLTESRQWPLRLMQLAAILPAAVAVELLLRALLSAFAPPSPAEPELLGQSLLASLWRWPFRPLQHLQDELNKSFGIDLRQSWAFAFIRRALLPVTGVLLGIAWLLTGLTEVPIAARGIYERFGRPVAVWQPGFHLGLPWPFGRVQRVENGVVHELAAATASDDDRKFPTEPEVDTAEGPPPRSANRLWDVSHVAEKSQVIASTASGDRQSFHIVNMDVRFMYRIGLSDEAALAARYNSEDLPGLIRSTAGRILVNYFASRTLEGVLGERRTQLADDIGKRLQADLDALNAGVEIMTTVVESIHPPAAAAYSYHSVQAAQIRSQAIISRERGNASQEINLAQLRANMTTDQATAGARETLAGAEAAQRRFAAERDAYAAGGRAFLLEQYLAQLVRGLGSARLVLVDHRLDTTAAAIDLRSFAANASLPLTTAPVSAAPRIDVDPMDK